MPKHAISLPTTETKLQFSQLQNLIVSNVDSTKAVCSSSSRVCKPRVEFFLCPFCVRKSETKVPLQLSGWEPWRLKTTKKDTADNHIQTIVCCGSKRKAQHFPVQIKTACACPRSTPKVSVTRFEMNVAFRCPKASCMKQTVCLCFVLFWTRDSFTDVQQESSLWSEKSRFSL